jgi:hypothetical protein
LRRRNFWADGASSFFFLRTAVFSFASEIKRYNEAFAAFSQESDDLLYHEELAALGFDTDEINWHVARAGRI